MEKNLCKNLHLDLEPVGIFFGNTHTVCDFDASPQKRNCLVPLLVSAAKGKVISVNEESCSCPGGGVGCCFGDGFSRLNPNIHKLLSQGFGGNAPPNMPEHLKSGERFFSCEEAALTWRNSLPFSEKGYPRTVFAPLSRWSDVGEPDLVYIFANPDQISALIILLGFHSGRAENVIAPFCAACQTIMYGANEAEKEEPKGVLGFFDISKRREDLSDYLTLTLPYTMWKKITEDQEKNCLTTHAWKEIEKRL